MNDLLIGLLSAVMATNQPAALSNLVQQKIGLSVPIVDPQDPVEQRYAKLLEEDDAALAEIDGWIKESQEIPEDGPDSAVQKTILRAKIDQRMESVQKAYEDFLRLHPKHTRARMAYGSFLSDRQKEEEAAQQWEKARELDPSEPAAWNNLANYYGHNGPVDKAFTYYEKAIELNPSESVYYHNFGTTVYLFRRSAMEHYRINEQQVFDKAMELYAQAIKLDPDNFQLATEVAQTYYGIKPPKTGDPEQDRQAAAALADKALAAWQYAFKLAGDDIERQGVLIHYARIQINAGRLEEARQHLGAVTNQMFNATKKSLLNKLEKQETNAQ